MPETIAARTLWRFGRRPRRRGWRDAPFYRRPSAWYAAVLGRVTAADLERAKAEARRLAIFFRAGEVMTDGE